MRAAALRAYGRAVGHGERELQHLLRPIGRHQLRIGAGRPGAHADIAAAHEEPLQLLDCLLEVSPAPEDADLRGHDLLHRHPDLRRRLLPPAAEHGIEVGLLSLEEAVDHAGGNVDVVVRAVAEIADELAHDHAGHDGLGDRVASQAVEAVHVPAGRLAGREEALEGRALAGGRRAHATHGVVLRGPDGDPFLGRVDAEEIVADLVHLAEIVLDVLLAQQRDVEPEMLAEAVLGGLALGDVFFHAPRHHVARGQLLLLGLVVGHEALAVPVPEEPAVAAAALGDQDAGGKNAGGVELHRLHVADRGDAGLQGEGVADALADHGVGGDAIQRPRAPGGDRGRLGHVGVELSGDQIADHRAVAAAAVVDQGQRLGALVHGDRRGDGLVGHGGDHRVAGAVGDIAGAPLLRAPEVALGHQPVRLVALGDGGLLPVDNDLAIAPADPAPGHAPRRQLAHRLRRGVDEHAHDLLIGAPVAAAYGVLEVHVLVVALSLDDIAEAGLHAALRRLGVRALGGHQRQDDDLAPAALGADGHPEPGQTTPDDEHVGVEDLHRAPLEAGPVWTQGGT